MVDLGTFGGNTSYAQAVSADGNTVVGYADNASNQYHAFRWTSAGMVDLGTFGGDHSYAQAVSADGNTVIGYAQNASGQNRAFMYRGRTLLDVDAWLASVDGNSRVYHDGSTLAGLPLEGAHHRPMLSFDRMGKEHQAWATGDFGSSSRTRDVHVTTGEAGLNWNAGQNGLLGFAVGHGEQNADLAYDGSSTTKGDYALVEYDYRPEGTQWIVSLLGMVGSWESKTNRGYTSGASTDFSYGVADIISRSARLRVDAPALVTFGGFGFAPYASYSVTQTTVGGYTETGGAFPATFDEQSHNAQEGRIGVTASKDCSAATKLLLTVEAIHRFDGVGPALTGQDITGGVSFSLPGVAPRADCVRFGFDVDHKLNENTLLNVSAHVATVGEAHDVSAAISVRRAF
jgi:probable HAF family extracellular repeat protein